MWEHYRKTFLMTQAFIVSVSLILLLLGKWPIGGVVWSFLVMQFCALVGARWAERLRRKITAARDGVPLRPR